MLSIKPLIDLLTVAPPGFSQPWFRQVEGAAEYARRALDAIALPACWLVRAADGVKHIGERAEHVTYAFDAVIAITNARGHGPGDTDDILLTYRRAVFGLLLGWTLEPDVQPIKFAGGQVIEYTDGDLYWRDRYQFDALITNYLPDPPAFAGLDNKGIAP